MSLINYSFVVVLTCGYLFIRHCWRFLVLGNFFLSFLLHYIKIFLYLISSLFHIHFLVNLIFIELFLILQFFIKYLFCFLINISDYLSIRVFKIIWHSTIIMMSIFNKTILRRFRFQGISLLLVFLFLHFIKY